MADRSKAARMAQNRADARGAGVPADVAKVAAATKGDAPKNLADAGTQWQILNPETMRYTLQLENDPRVIEVRITFTLGDELHRRIYENIEAFRSLLGIEMTRFNPDAIAGAPADWNWINAHREYLDPALMLSHVRVRARAILASLARFVDDDPERAAQRVTPDHIELGMDQAQLGAAILLINNTAFAQVTSRKKARAAEMAPA